jgi:hypothetical protein
MYLCWVCFTLVSSTPSLTVPFPLPRLPPSIFQQLSMHALISSTFTDVMCDSIVDALSFPFPFPPSPSSTLCFHCYKRVLRIHLCMIMFDFVYMFLSWIYLPHTRENVWLCLSESDLLHLTWCPPIASIYLQTPWCHSS